MKPITLDNIIEVIIKKFPEYKNSKRYFDESNQELEYIVVGNLALMAFGQIDKKNGIGLAERLLKFTDEIMNNSSSSDEILNLFQVEVFEKLSGSRTGGRLAKQLLHGKSLELLEQTLKYYNTDEFMEEYRRKD